MSQVRAVLGAVVFAFIAPGSVAGLVPYLITRWRLGDAFFDVEASRWIGALLLGVGVAVLAEAFTRFVRQGRGTPAPVAPPERLVVSGPYRYVRNPMYLAVLAGVSGQALLFGSRELLVYAAVVALGFHTFVVLYEEPTLRRRFGATYDAYRAHVPRWLPRLRPYRG